MVTLEPPGLNLNFCEQLVYTSYGLRASEGFFLYFQEFFYISSQKKLVGQEEGMRISFLPANLFDSSFSKERL
jgi:hypothetical protein